VNIYAAWLSKILLVGLKILTAVAGMYNSTCAIIDAVFVRFRRIMRHTVHTPTLATCPLRQLAPAVTLHNTDRMRLVNWTANAEKCLIHFPRLVKLMLTPEPA